jgi:hypothetical protein
VNRAARNVPSLAGARAMSPPPKTLSRQRLHGRHSGATVALSGARVRAGSRRTAEPPSHGGGRMRGGLRR